MADYTYFPFNEFSTNEICDMLIQSGLLGDFEFVEACRNEIFKRKPNEDETKRFFMSGVVHPTTIYGE